MIRWAGLALVAVAGAAYERGHVIVEVVVEGRLDVARRDGIDGDTVRRELDGQRASQPMQCDLAGAVG